jgi:plastocyanin
MKNGVIAGAVSAAVVLAAVFILFSGPSPRDTSTTTEEIQGAVIISNPLGSGTDTGLTFDPSYVRLRTGLNNTVTWVNVDTVPHTVTSRDRFFDQVLQPGQRFTYTFNRAGVYEYTCTLHPWMAGVVEVVN